MATTVRQGNTIDARGVNRALAHTGFGGAVQHFAEVASTNDLALEAAQAGARTGVWVADAQTAGRGRGGHGWLSVPGDGLYVSVLLTPGFPAGSGSSGGLGMGLSLSLLAGLASWEAIREVSGITVDIRWPNDLVTQPEGGGRSRKLGGVLVESAMAPPGDDAPGRLRYAVVGIGINVAHREFPPALSGVTSSAGELASVASSLFLEGWALPDRQSLLISLLSKLESHVRGNADGATEVQKGAGMLLRLAEASTWVRGKRVQVPEDGGYTGVTAGLDPSGFLLVDADDGSRRTVRSGGVREA